MSNKNLTEDATFEYFQEIILEPQSFTERLSKCLTCIFDIRLSIQETLLKGYFNQINKKNGTNFRFVFFNGDLYGLGDTCEANKENTVSSSYLEDINDFYPYYVDITELGRKTYKLYNYFYSIVNSQKIDNIKDINKVLALFPFSWQEAFFSRKASKESTEYKTYFSKESAEEFEELSNEFLGMRLLLNG